MERPPYEIGQRFVLTHAFNDHVPSGWQPGTIVRLLEIKPQHVTWRLWLEQVETGLRAEGDYLDRLQPIYSPLIELAKAAE